MSLSELGVWEIISQGGTVEDMDLPEESHEWAKKVEKTLRHDYEQELMVIRGIIKKLEKYPTMKEKALAMNGYDSYTRALVFTVLKDNEPSKLIWKSLKPVGRKICQDN